MKALGTVCAVAGLLLLGYCAVERVRSGLFQAREERLAEDRTRAAPPAAGADPKLPRAEQPRAEPQPGMPVGRIEIARLGVSAMVVEGADHEALRFAPGHVRGTALPGEGGNVAVAAHRDTFFRPLRFVRSDDEIDMVTPRGRYRYKVVSTRIVAPDDVRVLYPTGSETLTLITCYPFYFVGAAPKRFIVRAECVECPRLGPE